jgi:RNA polymerase sigma-70 factor, ECF subfamily
LTQLTRQKKQYRLDEVEELKHLVAQGGADSLTYKEFELRSRQAIDRLPPQCKTIFLLCRQEGMKYQEIADALDISLKAVENQMGIALKKLRADLKPFLTMEVISIVITLAALLYSFFS